MENEVLIVGIFVSAGVLSYVVIPGLLIMWDRTLDHMGTTGEDGVQQDPRHMNAIRKFGPIFLARFFFAGKQRNWYPLSKILEPVFP